MTRDRARTFVVPRLAAIVGLTVAVAASVGAIAWRLADPAPVVESTFGFADVSLVSFVVLGLAFASVGAMLIVRRPENAVGWLMVVIGMMYPLAALAAAATFSAVAAGPAASTAAGVSAWFAVLFSTVGGLVFALGLTFPTGRGQTPAWDRGLVMAIVVSPLILLLGFLIRPGPLQIFPTIDNPFGFGPDLRSILGPRPSEAMAGITLLLAPILVWSITSRYRLSDRIERQQLRWFIVSLLASVAGIAIAAAAAVLTERPPEAGLALFGFAGALIPIAIGIAILRYRLYDLDRIISRTIGWAMVSGALVAIFALGVIVLQAVLADVTEGETLAVAASTLLAFALFQPVRRRVQRAVDRRFDRARYDGQRTVEVFAAEIRNEVDLPRLRESLAATAEEAVRPAAATVWLRATPTSSR